MNRSAAIAEVGNPVDAEEAEDLHASVRIIWNEEALPGRESFTNSLWCNSSFLGVMMALAGREGGLQSAVDNQGFGAGT